MIITNAAGFGPPGRVKMRELPHISVCVCTFKRPALLDRLLQHAFAQNTYDRFTYSVVVVDNDRSQSAREVVAAYEAKFPGRVTYSSEPEQNIALARNRAVANATGEFVAFIDDDEFAGPEWLATLLSQAEAVGVDGVLGPVKPWFEREPPHWLVKGKFYDRPMHPTGRRLAWTECRTGNALLRRDVLASVTPIFRQEFGSGGEDRDLFRRLQEQSKVFVWCNEAAVYEVVPPVRWKRKFLIRRALLRGKASLANKDSRLRKVITSVIAIPVYTLSLPFLYLAGHHLFMRCLVRLCDHTGRVLALVGLNPVSEKYVTE